LKSSNAAPASAAPAAAGSDRTYDSHPHCHRLRRTATATATGSASASAKPKAAADEKDGGGAQELAAASEVWCCSALIAVSERLEEEERQSELLVRITRQIEKLRKERDAKRPKNKEPYVSARPSACRGACGLRLILYRCAALCRVRLTLDEQKAEKEEEDSIVRRVTDKLNSVHLNSARAAAGLMHAVAVLTVWCGVVRCWGVRCSNWWCAQSWTGITIGCCVRRRTRHCSVGSTTARGSPDVCSNSSSPQTQKTSKSVFVLASLFTPETGVSSLDNSRAVL
jgi:hypothetical protein